MFRYRLSPETFGYTLVDGHEYSQTWTETSEQLTHNVQTEGLADLGLCTDLTLVSA